MSGPETPPPPPDDVPKTDRIRASHADREAVIARLNTAFAEGRLDVGELDERVAAAYDAKTLGDLRPLTRDLPTSASTARAVEPARSDAAPRPVDSSRPADWVRWVRWGVPSAVAVNFMIWGIVCVATGSWIFPWWLFFLIPWVAGAFRGPTGRRRR